MSPSWASLVTQLVKKSPAMQDTWVQSLGWEGPLEKGMSTHSSILAWKIPYSPWGQGYDNSLQYSCLENPKDRGAWQSTVHGVTKSWARLSDFTSFHISISQMCIFLAEYKSHASPLDIWKWELSLFHFGNYGLIMRAISTHISVNWFF